MWRRCVVGAWRLESPVENNTCFPSATKVDLGMSRVNNETFYTAMRNLVLHADPKIPIDSDK